jgi:hypothetical protein
MNANPRGCYGKEGKEGKEGAKEEVVKTAPPKSGAGSFTLRVVFLTVTESKRPGRAAVGYAVHS